MPNRMNRRNLDARLRTSRLPWTRPLVAVLSAGVVSFAYTPAAADGELQLAPPINSTLTIRQAETTWTKRGEAPEPAAAATNAVAPRVAELPPLPAGKEEQPESKTQPAAAANATSSSSVSDPLDRFRTPQLNPPTLKEKEAAAPSEPPAVTNPIGATTGDRTLDREQTRSPQASQPVQTLVPRGVWQNRAAVKRSATPPAQQVVPQRRQSVGVRPPLREGNWVARDAINRVAPLRDPVPATMPPASTAVPKQQQRDSPNAFEGAAKSNVTDANVLTPKTAQPDAPEQADTALDAAAQDAAALDAAALDAAKQQAAAKDVTAQEVATQDVDQPQSEDQTTAAAVADPDDSADQPIAAMRVGDLNETEPIDVSPPASRDESISETDLGENVETDDADAGDADAGDAEADDAGGVTVSDLDVRSTPSMSVPTDDSSATATADVDDETETLQPLPRTDVTAKLLNSLVGPAGVTSGPATSSAAAEVDREDSAEPDVTDEGQELPRRRVVRRDPTDPTSQMQPQREVRRETATAEVAQSEPSRSDARRAADRSAGQTTSDSADDQDLDRNQNLDYSGRPAGAIQPNRIVAGMRGGIERTLRYFYDRPEVATGRSNWGMMHSMMVFGADTQLVVGRQKHSVIAWIAGNNICRGQRLLTQDAKGIQAKNGVGLQGHQGQFLAVLGMCNVPIDYPLYAGGNKYSVADLIEAEKRACKAGEELTFTLIGFAHYLDTDSSWIADDGTRWDFERLIQEELKQPIIGSACGGTHRLMGYAHALRKRRAEGKPISGQWKRAEIYTADFIDYAYSLQNRDGSMSTDWFEGRADKNDVDRKIQTTGHIVEWLLTVTPDDQLQNRRLVAAVNFLLRSIGSNLQHDWSIGPKGHALRSLAMYHQRVYRAGTPWVRPSIARRQR